MTICSQRAHGAGPWIAPLAAMVLMAVGLCAPAAAEDATAETTNQAAQAAGDGTAVPTSLPALTRAQVETIVREYLIANPDVIVDALREYERREKAQREQQVAVALETLRPQIEDDGTSFVAGNPDGDVTVVEFFDYRCGFCKRAVPAIEELIASDGNIRFVLKEFPILGPDSMFASRAAIASMQQDGMYKPFHDALMGYRGALDQDRVLAIAKQVGIDVDKMQADMKAPQVDGLIAANMQLARVLGIDGTPAFVIGDKVVPGAVPVETLKEAVAEARQG